MHRRLKIHPLDNIEVALTHLYRGELIETCDGMIRLGEDIPAKHKYAISDLEVGDDIIMYGVLVGKAKEAIKCGMRISTANTKHASNKYGLGQRKLTWNKPDVSAWTDQTFMGYHRSDGSVGVSNYWLIIPLVFCENHNVSIIREAFARELGYEQACKPYQQFVNRLVNLYQKGENANELLLADFNSEKPSNTRPQLFKNIDGVKMLTHTLGCGGTKEDASMLCGLLAGYITNSNVAGATIISLGCQNAQINMLREEITNRDQHFNKPLLVFEQQQIGAENELIQEAIKHTFIGLMNANKQVRQPAPLSKLCVGLECGGSDGFSGISANPALGYASDILVALGASVILSEFPELCGVEQELTDRCIDDATASKFIRLMGAYYQRAKATGSGFDANPSAGNIRDGLITDTIKSAGAAKKGGTSPIIAVLDYPEKLTRPGLNLLCTPGSDIESTTAEVGSGATIVVFTTGLGTPTGNPIAPVLKVSTNTGLYHKMQDIIDVDAGSVILGQETIEQVGARLVNTIIAIASGKNLVKALVSGHDDFIPWKRGISL